MTDSIQGRRLEETHGPKFSDVLWGGQRPLLSSPSISSSPEVKYSTKLSTPGTLVRGELVRRELKFVEYLTSPRTSPRRTSSRRTLVRGGRVRGEPKFAANEFAANESAAKKIKNEFAAN